ncbi:hypothetical protein [Sporolactobacillus terrae]|uniref:hypothetical protein n=1 Tax=Sporolactobacillus terrae TaxID=269673 RepID=UPI00048A4C97|nr:hypothetical protein [Sporolactobacillus terrae]
MAKEHYYPGMAADDACDTFLKLVDDCIKTHKERIQFFQQCGLKEQIIESSAEIRAYEHCKIALNGYLHGRSYSD